MKRSASLMHIVGINRQQGLSLIEVLVSLVIMAIGMLGAAGLFMTGLRGATDSVYRTSAAQAATEIADRMRINPLGVAAGNYVDNANAIATNAAPGNNCSSAACTPLQQATWDRITWARTLSNASLSGNAKDRASKIPQGVGAVCRDSTPDDGTPAGIACDGLATSPIVVKVWWSERALSAKEAESGNQVQRRYVLSVVPPSLP